MAVGAAAGIPFTGSEGGFLPPSLTGCALWLRADMGITSPDAGISRWLDLSASLAHVSQDTALDKPSRYATVGNALSFDGVDEFIQGAPVAGLGGAHTIGVAMQPLSDHAGGAAASYVMQSGVAGANGVLAYIDNNTPMRLRSVTYNPGAATVTWGTITQAAQTLVFRHDGAGGNADLCWDGAHQGTQAQVQCANPATATTIAANNTGGAPMDERVWAVIAYSYRLSDAETLLLNTYLTNLRNGTPAGSPPGVPVLWLERPDQWAGPSVSAWADQSGVTVYDFAQNTVADYPVLCLGDESTPFLHFDGVTEHLFRATIAEWSAGYTAAVVAKIDALSGTDSPLGTGDPGAGDGWRMEWADAPPSQISLNHAAVAATAATTTEARLNRIIFRHGSGQARLNLNGTPTALGALGAEITPHTGTDVVGGRTAGGGALQLIEGRVYEVAGYNTDVSDGSSVQLAEYLTSRYALNPNFVPTDIDDCGLWLRGDLGVTLDGEGPARWVAINDSSVFVNQDTTANKPSRSGVGAVQGLLFDGSNDVLNGAVVAAIDDGYTIGIAHQIHTLDASFNVFFQNGLTATDGIEIAISAADNRTTSHPGIGSKFWGAATTSAETWVARHSGAGNTADLCLNGAHQAQQAHANNIAPTVNMAVGARATVATYTNVTVWAIIAYSTRLSDADTLLLNQYLTDLRNGIAPTVTLPGTPVLHLERPDLWAGEAVAAWANQGSLGGSFEMGTATARPVLLPGASNGLPSMHFDDSNDRLTYTGLGPDFTYLHDGLGMTTMVVGAFNANGSMLDTCKDLATSVGANFEYFATGRQRINISDGSGVYIVASIGWAGEWPLNEYRAALWRAQTDAPLEHETRVDGSVVGSGAFLAPANTAAPAFKLTVGNLNNGGQAVGGYMPEVISHTRYLSQSECDNLESYANRRYAI